MGADYTLFIHKMPACARIDSKAEIRSRYKMTYEFHVIDLI